MTEEETLSESLISSAVRVLLRVAFVFEPLGTDSNYRTCKSTIAQIQGSRRHLRLQNQSQTSRKIPLLNRS